MYRQFHGWDATADDEAAHHYAAGTPVYGARGSQVGVVSPYHGQGDMLLVRCGRLFPADIAIPLTAITSVDARGIHLCFTRAQIVHHTWTGSATGTASMVEVDGGAEPAASA